MIFAPMNVNFGGMKVNVLDHGSILNMGPNQMTDFFISYKRNQGYGEQNGDIAPMLIPISLILDNDLSDSPTVKNSIL
ncbi:hypothetical protein JOC76_002772 [Neobacillus cucumis]|uniref:hypothetical protein n=2 Tax=Neobacillus cucumis TaxID=1740721 RepID=UPI0019663639|nr:hypothetical protein [Neobacillus cucumis]MBM7653312.1 hypothetical protein [Neobacillus cucumis]MDR4947417.1 hypothetical protein [Neobacillus cucumis]MED4224678.1 hypothetical protein [Neobacillus cucumis]